MVTIAAQSSALTLSIARLARVKAEVDRGLQWRMHPVQQIGLDNYVTSYVVAWPPQRERKETEAIPWNHFTVRTLCDFPIQIDDRMPDDCVELLVQATGEVLVQIKNLAVPC